MFSSRILNKNYRKNEQKLVQELIHYLNDNKLLIPEIQKDSYKLSLDFRKKSINRLRVENLMNIYPLASDNGRDMMSLSESLLRIKDNVNQENLIIEKVNNNWLVSIKNGFRLFLFSLLLQIASKVLPKNRKGFFSKLIVSLARVITKNIIYIISHQFVLASNIKKALEKSKEPIKKGYSFSYDMLGESARSDIDAKKYFNDYKTAILETGKFSKSLEKANDVSISIKLSSLHARYEVAQYERIKPILYNRLLDLCKLAAEYNLLLFIDAEEAERLNISLDLFETLLKEEDLKRWKGLGIVVQCYQKRGFFVIDEIAKMARRYHRKIYVRLVKGAYWDAEIKLDQTNGVEDFSLFTRKEHTDIAYMACVKKLASYENEIYSCFATHNAFSISYVKHIMAGKDYEFQCLQGMGGDLYDNLLATNKELKVRIYAPVGEFNHLLPYLVRRLIENGAKNSFINQILLKDADIKEIIKNPIEKSNLVHNTMNDFIKLPRDIFMQENRINSKGEDMTEVKILGDLEKAINENTKEYKVYSIVDGKDIESNKVENIVNPARLDDILGQVQRSTPEIMEQAIDIAYKYFPTWNATKVDKRADILLKVSDVLEARTSYFVSLLAREAGKSIKDSILEIREAVDFLRFYSSKAREEFSEEGLLLPSVVGEKNTLHLEGRGVFLCIAPWNFPLAIFIGQIAAALVAGNTVLAKPAEDTSLVGYEVIKLMLDSSLPKEAIQFLPARGKEVGETLLTNPKLAGVAFTGSDITARVINRELAQRQGAIIPLIAETGGQNAMIVDSSALYEQVARDVISSSFQSAGQRCSALRVLFLQDDIADDLIEMISSAMDELSITSPNNRHCDVGPVINQIAYDTLKNHCDKMNKEAKLIKQLKVDENLKGLFFPPTMYEIASLGQLEKEVFGPILHIVRYNIDNIKDLAEDIHNSGFGLTFGIHSRLDKNIDYFSKHLRVGNIYVNRNQIGAVVSSQPFGGRGNSGTGPKAGGPFYLHKFATEKTISVDLTAWGGNIDLMSKI